MIIVLRTFILFVVLAGLVHIFSIFATPKFAGQKVWKRVTEHTQPRKLTALQNHDEAVSILGQADPSMAYAICHFSLNDGSVTLTSDGPTSFWNVTLFNKEAEIIYSLHDDASKTSQLNLSILLSGTKPEVAPEVPAEPIIAVNPDDYIPTPRPSPNALEESESDEQEAADSDLSEEEGNTIQAVVNENQVFVVFKIFKTSRHHAKIIDEALETAQCK